MNRRTAMHIFSYVMTHDSGFAPNPFGGFLTLATCKPRIRESARIDDFVIGTGSTSKIGPGKLVYAAQVAKIISIEDYGRLPQYEIKRPLSSGDWWQRHGDNIYVKVDGEWKQRRNLDHFQQDMDCDLSGKNVLTCERFWYFGQAAIDMPGEFLSTIKKGPGHKRIKDPSLVERLCGWLTSFPQGIHGTPNP